MFIICNPLIDTIVSATYEQIERLGIAPGSMNLVNYPFIEKIRTKAQVLAVTPGGSGANTARGIAWLRGAYPSNIEVFYLGAVGQDADGKRLYQLMQAGGVVPFLSFKQGFATGVSLVMVTPDHQRTMCTYLGACQELQKEDIPFQAVEESTVLYLTGYNWDTPNQQQVVNRVASFSKGLGKTICLDLSDPFLVHRYKHQLLSWIPSSVDLLFGNREEIHSLTETTSDEEALERASKLVPTVVMKVGKEGCIVATQGRVQRIAAEDSQVRDTTGAGDSFAAGFLFGYLRGYSLEQCGILANRVASRIVSVYGCDYSSIDSRGICTNG
ncbi:MAG: adenosine kinase [Spirochaetales bacterium]